MAVLRRHISCDDEDSLSQTEKAFAYLAQTAAAMEHQKATYLEQALVVTEITTKLGVVIANMASTMALISDSSHRINDVVSVIDSVAFQSNIQSLYEYPQDSVTGAPGGFAVEASEMHNLAGHSAAAKEIQSLIDDSIEKVGSGSRLVADAAQSMTEVVSQIKQVNDLMAEIASASKGQARWTVDIDQT